MLHWFMHNKLAFFSIKTFSLCPKKQSTHPNVTDSEQNKQPSENPRARATKIPIRSNG